MAKDDCGGHVNDMFTVAHLTSSFLQDARVRVKTRQIEENTFVFYRFQIDKLIIHAGQFPAAELRVHHLHAVELSNHFVRVLKQVYKWAVEAELVPKDPFRMLTPPATGQRQRTLSPEEIVALYRGASPCYRLYLFLARHTLARPKELRELKWAQVDLAKRSIVLTRFKAKAKRKDGLSVRYIPLSRLVTSRLERLKRVLQPSPDAPVVPTQSGRHWSYTSSRVAMRTARERAGLGEDAAGERVVMYSLRHTGATEAVRSGVRDTELADLMGHTSIAMTRRYIHRTAADLVAVLDRRDATQAPR